jgi:hypothetical protein
LIGHRDLDHRRWLFANGVGCIGDDANHGDRHHENNSENNNGAMRETNGAD